MLSQASKRTGLCQDSKGIDIQRSLRTGGDNLLRLVGYLVHTLDELEISLDVSDSDPKATRERLGIE